MIMLSVGVWFFVFQLGSVYGLSTPEALPGGLHFAELFNVELAATPYGFGSADQVQAVRLSGGYRSHLDDKLTVLSTLHASRAQAQEPEHALVAQNVHVCGNAALSNEEECDDGNLNNNDGCNNRCEIELGWSCGEEEPSRCRTLCGDGIVAAGEWCDDGNSDSFDGCSETCRIER